MQPEDVILMSEDSNPAGDVLQREAGVPADIRFDDIVAARADYAAALRDIDDAYGHKTWYHRSSSRCAGYE